MKPPDTNPFKSITHNCCFEMQGSNVILIAKNNDTSISAIALASVCKMHGMPCICASYGGGSKQLNQALGEENVINLPIWSINPQSPDLGELIQRAKDENALLVIDAQVAPSFDFVQFVDAMNLRRAGTLSIVLSVVGINDDVPNMGTIWKCRPDGCVVHVLGSGPGDSSGDTFEDLWYQMPVWYSGEITHDMLKVLTRSWPYQGLPAIPELPAMFFGASDGSWTGQDRHVKAVVEMLASASEHAWKYVIVAFANEII